MTFIYDCKHWYQDSVIDPYPRLSNDAEMYVLLMLCYFFGASHTIQRHCLPRKCIHFCHCCSHLEEKMYSMSQRCFAWMSTSYPITLICYYKIHSSTYLLCVFLCLLYLMKLHARCNLSKEVTLQPSFRKGIDESSTRPSGRAESIVFFFDVIHLKRLFFG